MSSNSLNLTSPPFDHRRHDSVNAKNRDSSPISSLLDETTMNNEGNSNNTHKKQGEDAELDERIDANEHVMISSGSNSTATNTMDADTDTSVSPPTPKSKNIILILLYTFFAFSSRSLWNQSVLSAFVYLLRADDPKFVGILTCIMGVTQLASSFPTGILADKYRRDTILKLSAIVGIIAAISTTVAAKDQSYTMLGVSLSIWGLYWGASETSISALFADSMLDGDRLKYFTQRSILLILGNSTGPLSAIIMFSFIGNDWTIQECQFVLCAGQLLSIPALVMLFFLSDDYAAVTTPNTTTVNNAITDQNNIVNPNHSSDGYEIDHTFHDNLSQSSPLSNDLETPLLLSQSQEEEEFSDNPLSQHEDKTNIEESPKPTRLVPILISAADILGGLAAGMSIRYFPIFFLDNLNLTPRKVQINFLASTISMAILSQVSQRIASKIGILKTTILAKWIGAVLFLSMIISYQNHAPASFVSVLWVLRTAFMNSTSALTKSLLMDNVVPEERAKWSALESVNMFGWAGSAAFGGYLVDWEGIIFNFYMTVILQLVATTPFFFLLGKIKKSTVQNVN